MYKPQNLDSNFQEQLEEILEGYIKIQNQSSLYQTQETNLKQQHQVVDYFIDTIQKLELPNSILLKFQQPESPPALILALNTPYKSDTVLFYGYLDKQPGLKEEWSENKDPYKLIKENNKLYGRNVSEGGINLIATILMLKKIMENKDVFQNRYVLIWETDKNSNSQNLLKWFNQHGDFFKKPKIVYCMDSVVPNYDNFYLTQSLKRVDVYDLEVSLLKQGLHSGVFGGCVADSFRVFQSIFNNIENPKTGKLQNEFYINPPTQYYQDLWNFMKNNDWNYGDDKKPSFNQYLKNVWEPSVTIIGQNDIPDISNAGNVLRQNTTFRFMMTFSPLQQQDPIYVLNKVIEGTKLYDAYCNLKRVKTSTPFMLNKVNETMRDQVNESCQKVFKKNANYWGAPDNIGFLGQLQQIHPDIEFVITGIKSWDSNSKCGDENVNIDYVLKVYDCMSDLILRNYNL